MTRRIHLFTLWAAMLLMLGLGGPAAAQRHDEGQYRILAARYGTASQNLDVTERLRELAREDRRFRMGNDSFGVDPHPGQVKLLRIYARSRDGQNRTFEYVEGGWVDGTRFTGWGGGAWGQGQWGGGWGGHGDTTPGDDGGYQILQARYGTFERNIDVTRRLKELARQDVRFRMGNDSFGVDPAPFEVKMLRIYTRARNGQYRTFDFTEGSVVDGAVFTGWGSGQWGQGGWRGGWGDRRPVSDSYPGRPPESRAALTIVRATYGADGREMDVTERLRARVSDDRLVVQVDNELAGGDPAPHTEKVLRVVYAVGGGAAQRLRVGEGQPLSLP